MVEHSLELNRAGADVPAVLWLPRDAVRPPVVLIGHGGSGHKRSPRVVRFAQSLCEVGVAALAVDGPFHGDRARDDYQERIAAEGADEVLARMAADWVHALDAVVEAGHVDGDRVGVFGLSMGARYGIPVAAALGSRLRGAVFGKFGLTQSAAMSSALDTSVLTREAAGRIEAPVLVHAQGDDELFPFAGQVELFGAFASADKRLVVRPGEHATDVGGEEGAWRDFLVEVVTARVRVRRRARRSGLEGRPAPGS